ncbi:MAG: hypothetical protein WA093_02575 [Minisyncoccales bacterium]
MEKQFSKFGKPCGCRKGIASMIVFFVILAASALWLLIGQYNSYAG